MGKENLKDKLRCQVMDAVSKLRPMSRELCLSCKGGRLLCGYPSCPLLARISSRKPFQGKLELNTFGPSPSIFVGWKGYPCVSIGPLVSLEPETCGQSDDPSCWYGSDYDEIIRLRSSLVRTKSPQGVRDRTKISSAAQEIAMSVRPTDTEVLFEKKPRFSLSFSPVSQPMGPSGTIKKMELAENTKIPRRVEYVVNDEIKATDAASSLFDMGFDVYYINRVLSSGAMGLEENKKLVPTRWSITATDDMLGKALTKEIRDYPSINGFQVFSNTYLDNHFEVLLMPRRWEYELFEAWAPDTLWTMGLEKPAINAESEGFWGRTAYASQEGGGYYAARLPVLEHLSRTKRQAGAVIFREIYEGYIVPVGVWEVRENVRQAFKGRPRKFNTMKSALGDISARLRIPLSEYLGRSQLLRQRRIDEYI